MRSRKLAILLAALSLLVALPGVTAAAGPSAQAQARAEVLKYWTPERMKSAKWLDVVYDREAKVGKLVERSQFTPSNTNNGTWNGSSSNANDEIARVTGRVYFAFGKRAYIAMQARLAADGTNDVVVVVDETRGEDLAFVGIGITAGTAGGAQDAPAARTARAD